MGARGNTTNAGRNACAKFWNGRKLIMELVGEEKKIQALFSELRLADEQAAPSFLGVWNRAQLRPGTRVSPLNFSLAAAAFAVFVAVVALALWSNSRALHR